MKKYPLVKQKDAKDCGVSCMQMIINYYKGNISTEYLLDITKTSKKGTTAYHIVEAMKKIGFNSYGIKCKLSNLSNDNIILPAIAHVVIDQKYYHFVVIYEVDRKKKKILYADPEYGFKRIGFEEFEKMWSGVLLINYPIQKIINEKPPINFFKFITNIVKKLKKDFIVIVILSLFVMITSIMTSFFMQYMIDAYNISMDKNHLIFICTFFIILYFVRILSDYFRNQVLIYISQKIDVLLTMDVFKKIVSLPYKYYNSRTTGEVVSRVNDLGAIRMLLSRLFISSIIDFPLAILSSVFMLLISYKLFIITLITFVLYVIIIYGFKDYLNENIKKVQEGRAKSTSYMFESISGVNSIKGINIENRVVNNFERKYVSFLKDIFSLENLLNIQYLFKEIIGNTSYIIVVLIGFFLVIDDEITLGSLFSFLALLNFFLSPIRNLVDLDNEIRDAKSSFNRVLDLLYYKSENGHVEKFNNGNIVIKDLNYSYDDVHYNLKKVNLKINKGEKIMIMGPTGCGKSTLLKILMKFYLVKRGMVEIGGIDINDYNDIAVRNRVSYISQKEILFTDTLYNNLSFYSKKDKDLFKICKMCLVDQILKKNNLGYNILVEEDGFNFSGGEKQRIILARTLLKPFDILLIDEGLSQIDVRLERQILKNIFKYFNDKTIIIVSHRIDNKDLFDRTLYFKKNKVVEV